MSAISIGNGGYRIEGPGLRRAPSGVGQRRSARSHAQSARRRSHLTRRGRLFLSSAALALLGVLLVLWGSAALFGAGEAAADAAPAALAVRSDGLDGATVVDPSKPALIEHVVVPGDTVWSMATSLSGEVDTRVYVDRIQRLNGLGSDSLQVGDVVLLPAVD